MPSLDDIRRDYPEVAHLDDDSLVSTVHRTYYPEMPREKVAEALGYKAPAVVDTQPPEKSGKFRRVVGDTAISALKGAIGVPEAAVGLLDVPTGGRVGKFLENEGGSVGFRPKEAKAMLDDLYSPEQKAANAEVQAADGFVDTVGAAIKNPSTIYHAAVESLPSMAAGGVVGRGVMAVAPKLGAVAAGAIGEGVVAAGGSAEQTRQQTEDGLLTAKQAGLAAASGAATGALSMIGGAVARRLGFDDVDTLLAGGKASESTQKGFVRRVLEGAVSEGVLEELPQSIQEQVAQNAALGKPLDEGVDTAAAFGMLTGMAMGGGAQMLSGRPPEQAAAPADPGAPAGEAPQAPPAPPPADPNAPINFDAGAAKEMLDAAKAPAELSTSLGAAPPAPGNSIDFTAEAPADPAAVIKTDRQGKDGDTPGEAQAKADEKLGRWMERNKPTTLGEARVQVEDAAEAGMDLVVVPHDSGKGFTAVPKKWLGPQSDAMPQQGAYLPAPDQPQHTPEIPPSMMRDQYTANLNEFAIARGIDQKKVSDLLAIAERKPIGEWPAFFGKAVSAMQQAGFISGEITPNDLALLGRDPTPPTAKNVGKPAPETKMAERKKTPEPVIIDPVDAYIRGRQDGTPAGRAFAQDVKAGRISRADVEAMMARKPQTADERLAEAAAKAPQQTDTLELPKTEQPASPIIQAKTYRTKVGAEMAAKKAGGKVVPAPGGRYAVATMGSKVDAQPAGTRGTSAADVVKAAPKPEAKPEPKPETKAEEVKRAVENVRKKRAEDQQPTASWVIRNKATGEVIAETFDRKKVDALNTKKYEAVPIREHLAGINAKAKDEAKPEAPAATPAEPKKATEQPASRSPAVEAPRGKLVQTFNGRMGKGMLEHAASAQRIDKRKQFPDLTWEIVPAPEFGENQFKLEGREAPAPSAPETSAAPTDQGAPDGQKQEAAQTAEVLKPGKPAKTPRVPKHPTEVRGSRALAEISQRLGGLSPDLLADLSQKVTRERTSKLGKKTAFTTWDNPGVPGFGPLFRTGGTADLSEVARVLEEAGFITSGTVEADPIGAQQQAQDIIQAELKEGGSTLQVGDAGAVDAEMRRRAEAAMDAERDPWEDYAFHPDDLDDTGYTAASPDVKALTEQMLAQAEVAGIDTESIRENVARMLGEEASQDDYERAVQVAIGEALSEAGRVDGQGDAGADQAGNADRGQPAEPAGRAQGDRADGRDQAVQEGLTLTAQTTEDLKAKADAEAAAAKAEAAKKSAEQERLRRDAEAKDAKARADQTVDAFQLGQSADQQMSGMGDLFANPDPPTTEAKAKAERLTDAGEELIRNRRGKLKGLAWDDVSDMNDTLKVSQVVKANVWPRPDYAKMVEGGAPAWKAAALKAVYDKLAAAPVTRSAPTDADLRAYIETMNSVRDALTAELDRVAALPEGEKLWNSLKSDKVFGKVFPLPSDARSVYGRPSPFDRTSEQGKENNRRAIMIGGNVAAGALQFNSRMLGKVKDLLDEGFPAKQEAWQKSFEVRPTETRDSDIPEAERTGAPQERFFVYEKGSRWRLAKGGQDGGYASREQAEAFARSLTQKQREKLPPSRGLDLAGARRTGPDWRGGKNVTAQDVMDRFGFRGVNLGEYVKAKQGMAQAHLNHVFDAMSDLADILGVPPKAMSLNGTLGVAIGAQGSGKALAHFVPGVNEINITRDSGAGALAHEFGHAVDHYFAAQHGRATSMAKRPYLSAVIQGLSDTGGIRPEIAEAMRLVMRTINTRPMTEAEARKYMADQRELNQRRLDRWIKEFKGNKGADPAALDAVAEKLKRGDVGEPQDTDVETNLSELMRAAGLNPGNAIGAQAFTLAYRLRDLADEERFMDGHIPQQDTDYSKASDAMDAKRSDGGGYWSTPWEKFARAFETFAMDALKDRERESLYLSGLVDSSMWREWSEETGKAIPYPAGDERLAMQQAFQNLVDAIQTRADDAGNVAMFSRQPDASIAYRPSPRGVSMEDAKGVRAQVMQALPKAPPIYLHESVSKAPKALAQYIRDQGAESTVEAVYYEGEIHVFPKNVESVERMQFVVGRHEVRHHGLRSILSDDERRALFIDLYKSNLNLRKAAQEKVSQGLAKSRVEAVEEALADMPAEAISGLNRWNQFVASVRKALRAMAARLRSAGMTGLADAINPKEWTDNDIAALVARAEDVSRTGMASHRGSGVAFQRASGDVAAKEQTDSQAFKRWFGDSKVVDADGNPLVAYHGTTGDFSSFDLQRGGAVTGAADAREGFFFASNPKAADQFTWKAGDKVGSIMPVYLSLQNPAYSDLVLTGGNGRAAAMQIKNAKAAGHDGIIFRDSDMLDHRGQVLVAFKPEQIKSAIGNSGAFDPENPDIRFSRRPTMDNLRAGAKVAAVSAANAVERVIGAEPTMAGRTKRQYTPAQEAAMRNIGFMTEPKPLAERMQAIWQDAGKKIAQGVADQFAPIKDLSQDAYMLLRLSKGASGAFETLLKGGKLKLTDGVYDFDADKRGGVLERLLMPLQGEHHDFLRWVAANRAERLMGEGKENLFTEDDITAIKSLSTGVSGFDYKIQTGPRAGEVTRNRTTIYTDALRVFNEFQTNVLDMAEQSGLIDAEARALWEHEFYVPFYRVEDDGSVAGANIKSGVVRQQAFKSLTGRTNKLNADLLDNTLMNWAHMLDAAAKNRAAKASIEAAESSGIAQKIDGSEGKGSVWFMEGGEKRWSFVGDPMVMTAITALQYAGMKSPIMNALGGMKQMLTMGVTASPFFKVRNLIRDSVQVIASSPIGVNPITNVTEGWKLTDPKSDKYFRLLAGGGTIHFGTMMEGSEAKRVQKLVEAGVDQSTILDSDEKWKALGRQVQGYWDQYNELGNRGEAVNRASLYDQMIRAGKSHAEASLLARDLMDFSMQGSWNSIRFLAQVVPFFNARIQGMYKLGRAYKEDPARMRYVIGVTSLISLGLLAGYGDDDDWKKREEWDRNNYWWFKFGGTAFRIPKPFEIGAVATLAERSAEFMFDDEMTGKRFRGQLLALLGDNLAMNPIPQAAKPLIDLYANKDSFSGRPIETQGMRKLRPEMRYNGNTSMLARGASTAANAVTGLVGAEAPSPVQIDHLVRGYFGWLGTFVTSGADIVARPAVGEADRPAPDYWKRATGGIVSDLRDAPSRYVSQMYTQAEVLEQAYHTWQLLQKDGKTDDAAEFKADNADKLDAYRQTQKTKVRVAALNVRAKKIERSAMSAQEKRDALREIRSQQDKLARAIAVN